MIAIDERLEQIRDAAVNIVQKLLASETLSPEEKNGMAEAIKKDLDRVRDDFITIGSSLESIEVVRKMIEQAKK